MECGSLLPLLEGGGKPPHSKSALPVAALGACPDSSGSAGSSKRNGRRSQTAAPDGLYEHRIGKSRLFTLPPLAPRGVWSLAACHSSLAFAAVPYFLLPTADSRLPTPDSLLPSFHGASQSRA